MSSDALINVLYVDDEVHNLNSFKAGFRRLFNVFVAESAAEGRKILEAENIQVIITDQRMPVMTGIEFLESIIPDFPDPIRILLTGYADINAVIDAINKGQVYKYIQNLGWMKISGLTLRKLTRSTRSEKRIANSQNNYYWQTNN